MDRRQAEIQLQKLFGFRHFYDLQWKVIESLMAGRRVLFIEKTGYGKSLCFQFPATQMQGITIVFSPLIALMRDQIRSLKARGISTATINSNQTGDENRAIIARALANQLDILYIAPERMENAEWIRSSRAMKIAMVVVDEAHCISLWGQSFRPNYRRIVELVRLLPQHFPVLAITATATPRVQKDIMRQIGKDMMLVRGSLMRSNIRLFVVRVNSEDEKYFWLARYLPELKKPGIVYTGTQANTETFSNWLQFLSFQSVAYSGRLNAESRKRIESDFIQNKYDCVVSTNALGMGIDKPDIRFIIHTQVPQSLIHYYQEIGRAGRDGQQAFAILLYNCNEDDQLPRAFINASKPPLFKYEKVIDVVKIELLGLNEIIRKTNLKQTEVRVILADLIDQKIVHKQEFGRTKKYFYNLNAPALVLSGFEQLRKDQLEELDKMLLYPGISTCRMQYLCDYLGDAREGECGACDNDTRQQMPVVAAEGMKQKLLEFRQTYFPVLEVETKNSCLINGVAASYYGTSNVGAALRHAKYEAGGDFPDWLLRLTLKAFRKHYGDATFDMILYVPPTESGNLVKNFAMKIGRTLQIPVSHDLVKTAPTDPQKIFQSAILKRDNVKEKFEFRTPADIEGKRILLIDDIFDSGCTIKEIGKYLSSIGAISIGPLVIAKTVGGDI